MNIFEKDHPKRIDAAFHKNKKDFIIVKKNNRVSAAEQVVCNPFAT